MLRDAVPWDSRADANEYVRAWLDKGEENRYKVKKVECNYAIS